jgi:hypothetical protein
MGKQSAPEKTKEDRVRETVTLLKKLLEVGVCTTDPGYIESKKAMDAWIADGRSVSQTIEFPTIGRRGELVLPRKQSAAASLLLKAA